MVSGTSTRKENRAYRIKYLQNNPIRTRFGLFSSVLRVDFYESIHIMCERVDWIALRKESAAEWPLRGTEEFFLLTLLLASHCIECCSPPFRGGSASSSPVPFADRTLLPVWILPWIGVGAVIVFAAAISSSSFLKDTRTGDLPNFVAMVSTDKPQTEDGDRCGK